MNHYGVVRDRYGDLSIEVDGIVSKARRGDYHVQAMVRILSDAECSSATMNCSKPPSERELDAWLVGVEDEFDF